MSAVRRFADEQPNAEQQQYVQQHFQALRSLVKPKVVRVCNPIQDADTSRRSRLNKYALCVQAPRPLVEASEQELFFSNVLCGALVES